MPLSASVSRELFHTRTLDIKGYRRADGLWDIEGHLTDVKPFAYDVTEQYRAAGEPVHEMWLRLTIDEALLIHAAEAVTEKGPYRMCPEIAPNFANLAGIRIGPGWIKAIRQRVGGARGCTHLVEMLGQLGTAAMQTLWPVVVQKELTSATRAMPPGLLNSCHTYAADSPVVQALYPDSYQPKAAGAVAKAGA